MAADSSDLITAEHLSKHNVKDDCWIVVHSKVWDVTEFLDLHPGGSSIILKYAGSDATQAFDEVHAPGIIEEALEDDKLKGSFENPSSDLPSPTTVRAEDRQQAAPNANTPQRHDSPYVVPALHTLISASDFTAVAEKALSAKTWAFYSSAATDLVTHHANKSLIRRIMIRPRVLRDVSHVCMKRKVLGFECAAPFFISPAAMAKLAHPDGELALAKGAANEGIIQCVSSNASYPLGSILKSIPSTHPSFLQLYVNADRQKTAELLKKASSLGIQCILVTVDAPVPGKREADERIAAESIASAISGASSSNDKKGGGLGRLMAQYIDKSLTWENLKWIREVSGLPIVLKGVQSAEDAICALEYGVEGIMLSNHGGRSLDGAQPSILVLLELRRQCPEVFDNLEVYIDGGFERGSDILKALALGVTSVGIGRPFLYSLVHGTEGVEHLSQILKDELEVSMRLCGVTNLDQLTPSFLNTLDVEHLIVSGEPRENRRDGIVRAKI